ncbi:MAG: metalloregulator ArsR/SmtB family transcription factor [Humidesulfovibrio sp.]|uniref:ArsR/SmtB family transcription factor n=1 Tax=Humidesulfovibrio sp. TaxID=2910988 RepID=UPI0027FCA76F|nr:metalloregulator ArsR/SmtB family transcription factor [Humidesulfovibrio sp.]MDQ7834138.1 metalloregulator ArsR/SmtB family transcription factor [Humidesulfovibrio sp.]
MTDLLRIHKALADETRLRLVGILRRHELNVGELVAVMGMGQPRISRHLKILDEAGLVDCRREGLWAFYRAASSDPGRTLLDTSAEFMDTPEFVTDAARADAAVRERVQATRRFFDAVAGRWRDLSREVLGELDLPGIIAERVPEGAAVADLGCGPGELLERLSERACLVIGVDNSQRMLELAGQRLNGKASQSGQAGVSLRLGDLTHLPLREGEAHAAVLSMVLHHLPDPVAALSEARRVLCPGGRLIIADFDRHENEAMRVQYGDARLGLDQQQLRAWFEEAGFVPGPVELYPVNQGLNVLLAEAARP